MISWYSSNDLKKTLIWGRFVFHPSIDDGSEATDSDKEEKNDENSHKTPYDGENMNASSNDEDYLLIP